VRDRRLLVIVSAIVFSVIVALAVIPVPQTFSSQFGWGDSTSGNLGSRIYANDDISQSLCPAGATAQVSYSSVGYENVTFNIVGPNGTSLWSDTASTGNMTFTVPTCGNYQFDMDTVGPGTDQVSGTLTYSATVPLL